MPFGALYGRADWLWSSEYHTNTNLDPRNIQSNYSAVNLRLGSRLNNGLDVSVFVLNVLNKTVVLQAAVANLITDGSYQQYFSNPREVGLAIGKKF